MTPAEYSAAWRAKQRLPRPESEIRADLKRMLTEQLEAANKRLLQGPSPTE